MTNIAVDSTATEGRGTPNAWSPGSDGNNWTQTRGNQTPSFVSNQLVLTINGNTTTGVWTYAGISQADTEMLVNGTQVGASTDIVGAALRVVDANNWYSAIIGNTAGKLEVRKDVASSFSTPGSANFTSTVGTKYSFRFNATGTKLRARVWDSSTAEPTSWAITATDTSLSSGKFGVVGTPASTSVKFDTFSANDTLNPKDISTRFRLASLKDLASRFRQRSADTLKDVATRFILAGGSQAIKDLVARLRLRNADQLKDLAALLRLMSASQGKDTATRLLLMSARQLKDLASRVRVRSADVLKDLTARLRLISASQLKDLVARLRLMSANQARDVSTRIRVRSANQLRDLACLFRLVGNNTRLQDVACRFALAGSTPATNVTMTGRKGTITLYGRRGNITLFGRKN